MDRRRMTLRRLRLRGPAARDDRGAELVEFALVVPLFMLMMVGMFEFGFLFQRYIAVTNAAREGARLGVLGGYAAADVQDRVAQYLTVSGVPDPPTTTVETVSVTPGTGRAFNAVRVTVVSVYTFAWLAPVAAFFGGTFDTVPLEAVSVMRMEGS